MLTEAEWKEARTRLNQKKDRPAAFNERLLRQASVDSTLLTGHPAWDKYLERLQAELLTAQGEFKSLHDTMGTPLTTEQIHLTYVAINVIQERIRILSFAMTLPNEIMKEAAAYKNEQSGSMAQAVAESLP
jgi:hypothetical protein